MASCENCETISGVYKSAMAQITCTMEYGICTLGLHPQEDILLPSGTNPIQLETHGTTITLLSTPFNAHPNPQSPQTNPTIHNTQVHPTIPIGNYGVCGWKDRCRDGNLRTYCHVSPILFGWFFVEASPTCFGIFEKCFFCNLFTYTLERLITSILA